ncbi:hypothetical protein BHE74_00040561 [Ensete ventricosum]|nr:hypothetical protein BHE74_00040561 [Ensete ventricosum]
MATGDGQGASMGHVLANGDRRMYLGYNWIDDGREMRLGHDWTDDGREMRLGHDWANNGREMHLGHDWTDDGREIRLGHDWIDDGREMRLGHDWTDGGREVHLGHDWTDDDREVSGAQTNNKGWKARYFFVSGPSWGFRVDWSIHPISNVLPLLSEEESIMVNRLREILPLSRAIRDMTEKLLVEAGLSPASRGIHGHHYQMALLDRVHDSGRLVTNMGNWASLLEAELEKLKTKRDPEQLTLAPQRVDELEADNAKLRSGVDKLIDRLEQADKGAK